MALEKLILVPILAVLALNAMGGGDQSGDSANDFIQANDLEWDPLDANAMDMGMDANMTMDVNAMPPVDMNMMPPADMNMMPMDFNAMDLGSASAFRPAAPVYRHYLVSSAGTGTRSMRSYMDADSVRHVRGYVRGWETTFVNYDAGFPAGTRQIRALMEADCAGEQMRTLMVVAYDRRGSVLTSNQVAFPSWNYVVPETVGHSQWRFLCNEILRGPYFSGVADPASDARAHLPPETPRMRVPPQLRPRPRPRQ